MRKQEKYVIIDVKLSDTDKFKYNSGINSINIDIFAILYFYFSKSGGHLQKHDPLLMCFAILDRLDFE